MVQKSTTTGLKSFTYYRYSIFQEVDSVAVLIDIYYCRQCMNVHVIQSHY